MLACCDVTDQDGSETCFTHSLSVGFWTAFHGAGKPLLFVPSQVELASCTYSDVRNAATPPGQTLPLLQDTGAELQDAATAAARWGICPMGPQQGGRFSDVPDHVDGVPFPEPNRAQVEVAGRPAVREPDGGPDRAAGAGERERGRPCPADSRVPHERCG